jgi:N-acetylneuraminic acid mutarotase
MPTGRAFLAAAAINGIFYAVGGTNGQGIQSVLEAYNPTTDTWTEKAPMPTPRYGLGATAVNGNLYAYGGFTASGYSGALEAYNPATDAWTELTPGLPSALMGLTTVGDVVYAIGGVFPTENQYYDTTTGTWNSDTPLPHGRESMAVATIAGNIYATGGLSFPEPSKLYNELDRFNPITHKWAVLANPMPTARYCAEAGAVGKLFFVVGGQNLSGIIYPNVEAFHPR